MVAFMCMYVIGGKSIHRQYLGKGMNSCVKETTKHKTTDSAPSLKYMQEMRDSEIYLSLKILFFCN